MWPNPHQISYIFSVHSLIFIYLMSNLFLITVHEFLIRMKPKNIMNRSMTTSQIYSHSSLSLLFAIFSWSNPYFGVINGLETPIERRKVIFMAKPLRQFSNELNHWFKWRQSKNPKNTAVKIEFKILLKMRNEFKS
jgi:hypothetical protein